MDTSLSGLEGPAQHGGAKKQGGKREFSRKGWGVPYISGGKSPPLSLSFPKVCPSGLGHLLGGAAEAVPWGPGVQGSYPPATPPDQRALASRAQMERRRRHSLHTAGSCQAGCPSKGHRDPESAAPLATQGRPGQGSGWLAKFWLPFHHRASQRPTTCWALCQTLGEHGEQAPAPSLTHIGVTAASQFLAPQSSQKALGVKGEDTNKLL